MEQGTRRMEFAARISLTMETRRTRSLVGKSLSYAIYKGTKIITRIADSAIYYRNINQVVFQKSELRYEIMNTIKNKPLCRTFSALIYIVSIPRVETLGCYI